MLGCKLYLFQDPPTTRFHVISIEPICRDLWRMAVGESILEALGVGLPSEVRRLSVQNVGGKSGLQGLLSLRPNLVLHSPRGKKGFLTTYMVGPGAWTTMVPTTSLLSAPVNHSIPGYKDYSRRHTTPKGPKPIIMRTLAVCLV